MQKNNVILPTQTIGIIGGGQLGRMMAIAARYMGYKIAVLDPTSNCPTAQVADIQITAAYDDMDAIKKLTAISDVITYEFENVDLEAATYIEQQGKLPQGAYALEITQNREKEKRLMKELNLSIPAFAIVTNKQESEQALEKIGYPSVIKTCRGGYDGKGQLKLHRAADIEAATDFAELHKHCIIEEWIPFDKEISVIFTRTAKGEISFFPIAENEHRDHILYQTTAPARITAEIQIKAYEAARILAEKMKIVGTFAIEMFVNGEDIYLNEMAPRPHNSGHYTIEACNISQFGQHIRAICGLPLMQAKQLKPAIMLNILGEDIERISGVMTHSNDGFIHLYGKEEAKAKRKMGHITFIGNTFEEITMHVHTFEEAVQ
ncbi:5-(carboxyamino)imidazole ribonucleotide synthase [Oceanobacillus bengalensis]|uniref:N5-carboxyaminoimidazole ribonucleotide synthase n=1 Tax=Oceanobacillus bengalensis TaxID=1435466 RepID=A0A494YUN4_9BACI|nr:5-(carboxyamino)imidazole ribonucleotide synthase [Oceanobacillus bengalensis]RKQ13815.1 5-(carboxyamino)imidazole ribonucleotide synthase [Oceanobacillus bengalensis]